jgi:predicted nucleic acid-binding protein
MSGGAADGLDLVVDASVGVKWLVPESHSVEASFLMTSEIRRHVPSLFYTEVSQTIWKKVHTRHELSDDEGRETFRRLRLLPLNIHPIDPLFDLSFEIALQTGRTVYDSVYVALARSKGWKFVTADERLYNALKSSEYGNLLVWVGDIPSTVPKSFGEKHEKTAEDFVIPDVVAMHSVEEIGLIESHYTNDRLTDDHLAHLSKDLGIKDLDLTDSLVTDSGLAHLSRLVDLKLLVLRNTGIGNAGLLHLRDLQSLETLDLTGTYVTDDGLEFLRNLPRLRTLYLDETETTEVGRSALRVDHPGLMIP